MIFSVAFVFIFLRCAIIFMVFRYLNRMAMAMAMRSALLCVCGPFCKTTFLSMWKTVSIDLVFLPRTKVASNYCHSTSSFFFFCFSQGDLFGLHGIFRLKWFNNSALFLKTDVWIRLSGHSYCNILRNKHFLCLNSQRDENMHAFFCMDTYEILWATHMTVMENCRSHDWPRPFEYHDKPHTANCKFTLCAMHCKLNWREE